MTTTTERDQSSQHQGRQENDHLLERTREMTGQATTQNRREGEAGKVTSKKERLGVMK
jgi:hypothetical protein